LDKLLDAEREICRDACTVFEPKDSDLEEIKSYRLYVLAYCFQVNLMPKVCQVFIKCYELIEQMGLSNEPVEDLMDVPTARGLVVDCTAHVVQEIDLISGILRGSDLNNIQARWPTWISAIEDTVKGFMELITRIQNNPTPCRNYTQIHPSLKVTRALFPLIKLSRMFFKKLLEPRLSKNQLGLFTDLPSNELAELGDMPEIVHEMLVETLEHLKSSSIADERGMMSVNLIHLVEKLDSSFIQSFGLVQYFISQISDTQDFHQQNHYLMWFGTWDTTFTLAVRRLLDAVDPYEYEDCQCPQCLQPHPPGHQAR
jgi:hypothetical protein